MTPEDFKAAMQADKDAAMQATRAKWQGMVDEVFGPREVAKPFDDIVRCDCGSSTKCGRVDCRSPWAGAVAYGDQTVSSGKVSSVPNSVEMTWADVTVPECFVESIVGTPHLNAGSAAGVPLTDDHKGDGQTVRFTCDALGYDECDLVSGIDIDGKFHPVRTRAFKRTLTITDGEREYNDWREIEAPASKAAEILAAVDRHQQDADAAFWAKVPEGFDWVAMDKDGWAGACSVEPTDRIRSWASHSGQWRKITALSNYHPRYDWRNSLRRRPEGL